MEITFVAEVLDKSFNTLKGFVHKPGSETTVETMTAAHIIANKKAGTVTFIGNNASQKLSFTIEATVESGGEVLVSVADMLTALSTISDKAQSVTIRKDDNVASVLTKAVSVSVPLFDIEKARVRPKAPSQHKGDLLSLTVSAEELPKAVNRAIPPAVDSSFPKVIMWVENDKLCFAGMSPLASAVATVDGVKVTGSTDLVLWDQSNLRRIIGLAANADEVRLTHDANDRGEPEPVITITVTAKDITFIVEQNLETLVPNYGDALGKVVQKVTGIFADVKTSVTLGVGSLQRPMESAERVRAIGRDNANAQSTAFELNDNLLTVSLIDETFSEEITAAKTTGTVPSNVAVNSKHLLALLAPLGTDAKVTCHFPPAAADGRTSYAILTCQDTDTIKKPAKGELPATGYLGVFSFRGR